MVIMPEAGRNPIQSSGRTEFTDCRVGHGKKKINPLSVIKCTVIG